MNHDLVSLNAENVSENLKATILFKKIVSFAIVERSFKSSWEANDPPTALLIRAN